jgi:hypothetical protein
MAPGNPRLTITSKGRTAELRQIWDEIPRRLGLLAPIGAPRLPVLGQRQLGQQALAGDDVLFGLGAEALRGVFQAEPKCPAIGAARLRQGRGIR